MGVKSIGPRSNAKPPGDPDRKVDADVGVRKAKFLAAYAQDGTIAGAARIAKIGRSTYYDWCRDDPRFVEDFKLAQETAIDAAESEARKRAIKGVTKPVWYQGEVVGHVVEKSDQLLMFYLRGRRSEVFKDNLQVTGGLELSLVARLAAGRGRVSAAVQQQTPSQITGIAPTVIDVTPAQPESDAAPRPVMEDTEDA